MVFTVFEKAQSSKVWSKLERELMFGAKPRAGVQVFSIVLLAFRSELSGAKQCSDREGKLSKSELCTGIAEQVMFLLCFRSEGSGAKQLNGFEGKISKSELRTGTAEGVLYLSIF